MRHHYTLDRGGRSLHWVLIQLLQGSGQWAYRPTYSDLHSPNAKVRVSAHKQQDALTNRPRFVEESTFLELTDEVHDWLVNAGYEYQPELRFHDNRIGFCVGFRTKDQAAHFKLAWGV